MGASAIRPIPLGWQDLGRLGLGANMQLDRTSLMLALRVFDAIFNHRSKMLGCSIQSRCHDTRNVSFRGLNGCQTAFILNAM